MADRAYTYDPVSTGAVNHHAHRMEAGQLWRQYIIAGIANIAIVSTGVTLGWTSPIESKLTNATTSPLGVVVSPAELAWIGSLLTIGAIVGPFIGGFLANSIGRKWGLIASSIPLFVGWILVTVATNVAMIYAGRIFWGVAIGMLYTISPMYCAEIATDDSRGALGSFLQLFITFGFLLVYGVGPYVSYTAVSYVGIATVAVFDIAFFFMPESPSYHLIKKDREAAANCLSIIRGKSRAGIEAELDEMATSIDMAMSKTAKLSDLLKGGNFKAMYISCALVFFQQFSGINAVLFYMNSIFEAAGSSLEPAIATIVVGCVQCGASAITPLVVDRLGRRILLLVSSFGSAVGLGLLGMFFLLQENESPVLESIGFLPLLSLVLFILTYCWGLGPLPWAVMGELFPMEVKAKAAPIATAFCWALSFLVTRYFSSVANAIGNHFAFWIFGICCVASFLFVMFLVPETKGKSFSEIQEILEGKSNKSEKKEKREKA